jgi:hypothetical protein
MKVWGYTPLRHIEENGFIGFLPCLTTSAERIKVGPFDTPRSLLLWHGACMGSSQGASGARMQGAALGIGGVSGVFGVFDWRLGIKPIS